MRTEPHKREGPLRRAAPMIRLVAGYGIAVGCLIWIFHDIRLRDLLSDMRAIRWRWVPAAILCDLLSYACQGLRLSLLTRRIGRISPIRATQAVYAGLFASEVFPMRAGEVVRAYLVSRWASIRISSVVPVIAAERLFDGVWLAAYIGITTLFVPLPRELLRAARILGWALAGVGAGLGLLATLGKRWRPLSRIADFVRNTGSAPGFYGAFGVSGLILVLQSLAVWLMMLGYGLHYPVLVGAVVLLIVYLGTAVPNAPGNVGTYQFFVVVALSLFHVDKTTATGFSIVLFFLLTAPLWAVGSISLGRSGITLERVRREARQWMSR